MKGTLVQIFLNMNKKEIRQKILKERSELSGEFTAAASYVINGKIMALPEYEKADIILGYYATRNEPDMSQLFHDAISRGKKVYLPRVIGKREMQFFRYLDQKDVAPGSFGIMEPVSDEAFPYEKYTGPDISENDKDVPILIIMPGVAFDHEGNRIGYGGGYYDRYLSMLGGVPGADTASSKGKVYKTVMTAYNMQRVDKIPAESTDIRPDMIITEE